MYVCMVRGGGARTVSRENNHRIFKAEEGKKKKKKGQDTTVHCLVQEQIKTKQKMEVAKGR